MRLIVTGAHGQIAQSLIKRAPCFGIDVTPLARPDLDLSKHDSIVAAIKKAKPDIVVNAAAYTQVDLAETTQELAKAINAEGAEMVARACAELDIPIIHISTDYVFDGEATSPYNEEDETNPQSVYGKTKLLGEELVANATPNHVILRTSWLYSPFSKNFVKTMLELADNGKTELSVVKDQFGAPTSTIDLADAIFEIARNLINSPDNMELRGIFNATGAGQTNWARFARYILAYSKRMGFNSCIIRPITSAEYGAKAPRPNYSVLDNSKLINAHGILPRKWQDSVKEIIRNIKEGMAE